MKMRVGFIGLGLMGKPMALNLLRAGYPLTVWNRTAEKMRPLTEAGAEACTSPRAAADGAEIIFIMVTDAPQVHEVLLGPDGVVHGARPGSLVIDCSSIAPAAARDHAAALAERGIAMLDAPVSGGPEGAAAGTLSIMVGGDDAAVQHAMPLLEVLGRTIRHLGPTGTGQLVKLCNQVGCAMSILAMAEAFALAERGGADLAVVREVLMGGAAGSWMLEHWAPKILHNDYTPGFTVNNFQKDLRNVLREAAALNAVLPATAIAHQLYRSNEAMGEGEESNVAVFKVLMRLAGERV